MLAVSYIKKVMIGHRFVTNRIRTRGQDTNRPLFRNIFNSAFIFVVAQVYQNTMNQHRCMCWAKTDMFGKRCIFVTKRKIVSGKPVQTSMGFGGTNAKLFTLIIFDACTILVLGRTITLECHRRCSRRGCTVCMYNSN